MKGGSELLRYQLPDVTIYEHTHFQERAQVVTQGRYDDDPGADVDWRPSWRKREILGGSALRASSLDRFSHLDSLVTS